METPQERNERISRENRANRTAQVTGNEARQKASLFRDTMTELEKEKLAARRAQNRAEFPELFTPGSSLIGKRAEQGVPTPARVMQRQASLKAAAPQAPSRPTVPAEAPRDTIIDDDIKTPADTAGPPWRPARPSSEPAAQAPSPAPSPAPTASAAPTIQAAQAEAPKPAAPKAEAAKPDNTFSQAFAAARRSGQKEFTWSGKRYHTRTKEEDVVHRNRQTAQKKSNIDRVRPPAPEPKGSRPNISTLVARR